MNAAADFSTFEFIKEMPSVSFGYVVGALDKKAVTTSVP
jgi:hypothetical protein